MTRREKVLQRTRVGLTLALAVAGLLYASSLSFGAELTRWLAVALSLWCVFEVNRMGLFRHGMCALGACVTILYAALFMGDSPFGSDTLNISSRDIFWVAVVAAGAGLLVAAPWAVFGSKRAPESRHGEGLGPAPLPNFLVIPLLGLSLVFLYPLRLAGGAGALAAFVGLAKIGDIAGYYFGNLMGKSHPFPRLSPGKTTAGCVASLIAGTAVGALLASIGAFGDPRYGVLSGLAFGALVNVTAQAGDLLESALKRRAGVKDSGTTFGPSGGMLDLVDSFFLAAPLAAFAGPLLFHWA